MVNRLIVDLHIHSHYSRATSKDMDTSSLYRWGKIKGIQVIGTGDFTHPLWLAELKEKMQPAEPGLFTLKDEYSASLDLNIPLSCRHNLIRFILTAEISCIYSKHGRVRKVHHVVVAPSFEAVDTINSHLAQIGNLRADGRPILGLDSKELLRICIKADPRTVLIPAHVWTPWFSLFGSRSGFDSLEEAFEELTPHIKAVETGLSSDPFMNWRWSKLDNITLVSHSDAHSPRNLGREANILSTSLSYDEIMTSITSGDERFIGTIEFFPQEGKYHYDGHRTCKVCFSPEQTKAHQGICPICKQPLVLGVDYRVDMLADKPAEYRPINHKQVEYIVPLAEMIKEIKQLASVNTKSVMQEYERVISSLGNEFAILRTVSTEDIKQAGFEQLSQAITYMRQGKVEIQPGFDGVYGTVQVLNNNVLPNHQPQLF